MTKIFNISVGFWKGDAFACEMLARAGRREVCSFLKVFNDRFPKKRTPLTLHSQSLRDAVILFGRGSKTGKANHAGGMALDR